MGNSQWIPTVCYQCKAECAILARVEDGKVKEIRGNPRSHGKACVKGMSGPATQYNADRLKYPLKRVGERGEARFERITWDEAMNILTNKLRELKDRGEAHKLTASFFPHSITDPKWRFLNAYGGFINTALPHCDSAKIVAFLKTFGGVPNHHIPPAFFTVPKDGIMILSGRHAFGGLDNAAVPKDILDAKARGAKLIVLDPLFTADAAKADEWIPIKPGGDTAFFLGMTNHIIAQGLYNKEFVENWVREGDFEKLKAWIADKTPEAMSEICGVEPVVIKRLAEQCAKAPSVGVDSFKGIMLGQALDWGHAWCIFLAVTGNVDNPGGQPFPDLTPLAGVPPAPPGVDLMELGFHRTGPNRAVFDKYSFIMEPTWYQAQAIKDDGLKVLILAECNPALTEMGQSEWQQAVRMKDKDGNYKLELLVCFELMMSEVSVYADLVLPDKSYFERWELLYMPWWYNFGHGLALRQPVVESPGECRHSNIVFIELGKRLVPEYFQFKDDVAYYDTQLAGLGLSVEKLQKMGGLWSPGTMGFYKYRQGGLGTPSKKAHLYWEDLEGPPAYQAWPRPGTAPEYAVNVKEYPFILVSYRTIFHQGSGQWTHNNPHLRDSVSGMHENYLLINTATAKELGIADGEIVKVESPKGGKVSIAARLTEGIRPDCVGMAHGFGSTIGRVATLGKGVSDNLLIPDAGSTLEWQDVVAGESHVSTRVRIGK
ncbi:MAG: formate dehydrogenase [Chloroflexi bacterium]|nr:formate dehydrogenase [Chloroflexota bacterium]